MLRWCSPCRRLTTTHSNLHKCQPDAQAAVEASVSLRVEVILMGCLASRYLAACCQQCAHMVEQDGHRAARCALGFCFIGNVWMVTQRLIWLCMNKSTLACPVNSHKCAANRPFLCCTVCSKTIFKPSTKTFTFQTIKETPNQKELVVLKTALVCNSRGHYAVGQSTVSINCKHHRTYKLSFKSNYMGSCGRPSR